MSISKIDSTEQLNGLYEQNDPFFLMKNSLTCPVSSEALKEMEKYASSGTVPVYYLNVQELREASNAASEKFGIKHESPQVLLIRDNAVEWDASHWKVTKKNAEKAAASL